MRRKSLVALILNIILVIFGLIGVILASKEIENILLFYTEDSNILAIISSLLFVIFLIVKKDIKYIPTWVCIFRYVATCCLSVTMIVVITILIPSDNISYFDGIKHFMLEGSMLFHHFLCPVISFISFTMFEGNEKLNKKKTIWFAIIPTFIYGLLFTTLNVLRIVDGPYPFLRVHNQSWFMSIVWIIVIFVGNYLIAKLVLYLNQLSINKNS